MKWCYSPNESLPMACHPSSQKIIILSSCLIYKILKDIFPCFVPCKYVILSCPGFTLAWSLFLNYIDFTLKGLCFCYPWRQDFWKEAFSLGLLGSLSCRFIAIGNFIESTFFLRSTHAFPWVFPKSNLLN